MVNFLLVGFGGFIGSVARYLFSQIPIFEGLAFPVSTLIVNFIGSIIIGMISSLAPGFKFNLFFKIGLCGGLTTFSAFSLETFSMIESGKILLAVVYCFVSVALSLAGVFLGSKMLANF